MRLNRRILMTIAALMTVFHTSTIDGRQQELPMDETVKVITAVAPIFPPIVVASNTSGDIIVELTIDRAGKAIAARVLTGHPLLSKIKSIEDTALQWRFIPAAENTPLRKVQLTFAFRITPKGTPAHELTPVFIPPYKVEVRHTPLDPLVHSDPPTSVRPTRRVKRRP